MATLAHPEASLASQDSIKELHHWINGAPVSGASGRFGDVYRPASGAGAVAGAARDRHRGRRRGAGRRGRVSVLVRAATAAARAVLFRFREIFERRLDEVAALLTSEHGKVNSDARGECTRGLEVVELPQESHSF